ncbi:MAG: hypothetical protein DRJ42_27305 [Deltaproteobacteria bacterium]|nr:MAG: hypothetical protein DRJ42_27305 [Deltaproteobacteria bacterium]
MHLGVPDMLRPQEKRRPAPHKAGFTLTEMMVVVAIISVTAGLAAPSMYGTFAENRIASAPIDLVRVVRRARSEAQAYGRAHLLRFSATAPGVFTVYRGVSSSCSANAWATTIIPAGACGAAGSLCVDELDLSDSYYSNGSLDIRATESGARAAVDLCFEPYGRTLHRFTTAGVFSDQNTVNGGLIFNFMRYESGSTVGVTRRVVVPLGGDARVMR